MFKLAPDGTETVLYSFMVLPDGTNPASGLWLDTQGDLYGTTPNGGNEEGTVFKISPQGSETVLYRFLGGNDGSGPNGLISDGKGTLYGTTQFHGKSNCLEGEGCGGVFRVTDKRVSVVYSLPNQKAGRRPESRLLLGEGKRGILYGTTAFGGQYDLGVAFKVTRDRKETVLHSFNHSPSGPLTADPSFTHLFGETLQGGKGGGLVYVLRP